MEPPAAVAAAARDLREISGQIGNIAKASAKRSNLHGLNPVLSHNEIVPPPPASANGGGGTQKARNISDLVHAKPGAPATSSVIQPDQTSLHLYAPETNLAISDAELLNKTFASGPKLILEGKFGTMEEFIRAASNHARKATTEARQALAPNMGHLVPTADTVASATPTTQPTKRHRKPGAAAALLDKRKVPTLIYGRYSDAVLALYAPGPASSSSSSSSATASADASSSAQKQKIQKVSHGTRHLYREFSNARLPTQIYAEAIARVAEEIDRVNTSVSNRGVFPEPTKLTWNYVQEMAYVEAKTDEESCKMGSQCVGFDITMHPKGGCFVFRRWIPPYTQRMHKFCYACILELVAFSMLVHEASSSNSSGAPKSYTPFLYSCNVPGEYNSKAFLKDKDGVGLTNCVRIFTTTDVMPAEDTPDGRRRYQERPTLKYFDGSRRLSNLPPINPQSYVDFETKTMTNERMLMVWLFRDVAGKFRDVVKRELPDWMKIMRLALLPFEEALAILVGLLRSQPPTPEAAEFCVNHLPSDFLDSRVYLYYIMDLYDMAGLEEMCVPHPKINDGYFVYFLLHIRVNAYLRMLSPEGLELLLSLILNGVAVPGATVEAVDERIKSAPHPADMPMPDPPRKKIPRAHASYPTQKETLQAEFEAKRIQLNTLVESHNKMMNHILAQFRTKIPLVHDDALLRDEVWATIKPGEEYLGPFFPEDRRFQEVIREPALVYQPGPSQRLLCILRQWCVPVTMPAQPSHRDATLAIVHGLCIDEKIVAWIGEKSLPLSHPPAQVTFTPTYDQGSVRFDYELLFGDTRAVWYWLRSEDTDVACLDALLAACNYFVDTWDYGKRYHPRAAQAIRQGAAVWRKKYSLLVALLLRVHCATVLCTTLEGIRSERKRFSTFLDKHEDEKTELFSIIAARLAASNVSIMDYELSPEEERLTIRKPKLEDYRKSVDALEEAIYCLKRFINSHLPLAHSMVVNCTDKDGEGPVDSILLDPSVPKCVSVNDDKTARPSLFELLLPENDNVMCEDNLPDCSAFEHQLKFISDSGVHEPILTAQQKTAPVRCHTRDAAKQSSLMAAHNAAFLKYCVTTLYCTMMGYRKSTYRLQFDKNLELYHTFHEHIVSAGPPESRPNYQTLLNECKQLSINAIRENTALHISASVGFYMAIKVCFAKSGKDYSDFERQWLPNCTNEIRRLYDQGASLQAINATIRETQSRSRSFVYRRTRTDFFRFAWTLLKEVLCKRIVNEFMAGTDLEWPNVLTMHRDYTRGILRIVNSLNPHTEDFDYGPTLEEVGCIPENVKIMKRVEARFNTDQSFNMAAAEAEVESFDECQHLVIFAFFNALRAHAAIRITPLSERVKEMQIEAVLKRTCSTDPGAGFPAGLCILHLCSVNGCHKRKTPTVQERGLRYIGNSDVSWDSSQQAPVCKPKKTAKGGSSKAARKQRKEKSLSAIREVIEAEKARQPTITNSSGKYQASSGKSGRGKKKAAKADDGSVIALMEEEDDDEEGEDDAIVDDFFGDGDESAHVQDAKSIKVALRAFLDEDFYVAETLKKMISEGAIPAPDGGKQAFPGGLSKVRKLFDTLQKKRIDLQKAARKEANALVRSLFDMPCEDGVITSHCMLGNVVRRDFIKEKANGEAYTLCPSCGCVSFFRTDMIYANGFTCGECDARLREDLLRPCCIGCQRVYLTLDRERKIKKPKGAVSAQGDNAAAPATAPLIMVVSNGVMSLPPVPGASATPKGRGASANAIATAKGSTQFAVQPPPAAAATPTPVTNGKRTGIAGGKKAKKRKKSEKHRAIIVKPATNIEEDMAMRSRRTGKGPNVMAKLGSDEWFSYNLYDESIGERRMVYVCGECNYERNFLRSLERMLTVSDFVKIISSGITNFSEAQRLCEVSAKDVTMTETDKPQMVSAVDTSEAKAKVEKKLATKRSKKRTATVMTDGTVAMQKANASQSVSKEKLAASDKAVSVAMASAGLTMDGKKRVKEGAKKGARAGILASIKKLTQRSKNVKWQDG